jgi:hypothetical protein
MSDAVDDDCCIVVALRVCNCNVPLVIALRDDDGAKEDGNVELPESKANFICLNNG